MNWLRKALIEEMKENYKGTKWEKDLEKKYNVPKKRTHARFKEVK